MFVVLCTDIVVVFISSIRQLHWATRYRARYRMVTILVIIAIISRSRWLLCISIYKYSYQKRETRPWHYVFLWSHTLLVVCLFVHTSSDISAHLSYQCTLVWPESTGLSETFATQWAGERFDSSVYSLMCHQTRGLCKPITTRYCTGKVFLQCVSTHVDWCVNPDWNLSHRSCTCTVFHLCGGLSHVSSCFHD